MAKRKVKKITTYPLYEGTTLQGVIDYLNSQGITDLSKVTIGMDSTYGCSCGPVAAAIILKLKKMEMRDIASKLDKI